MAEPEFSQLALEHLVREMPVGIIYAVWDKHPQDGGKLLELNANNEAVALLDLRTDDGIEEQLKAFQFNIDQELIGSNEPKAPLASPVYQAIQGQNISRRDLSIRNTPISLHSKNMQINSQFITMALIQLRDHRLFNIDQAQSDLLTSEISLRDTLGFDKLISRLSSRLINSRGFDAIAPHINDALAALGEFCQTDRVYVMEFDEEISFFSNTYEWVRSGATSHIDDLQQVPRTELKWFFSKIENEGLFVVHDVADIPKEGAGEKAEFEREDIRSVVCIGMYSGEKLIGFVGCDMVARHRYWTEADIRRIRLVGDMIANAIQSQKYIYQLEQAQHKTSE